MGITVLSTQEPMLSQPWVCASSIALMLLEKEKTVNFLMKILMDAKQTVGNHFS